MNFVVVFLLLLATLAYVGLLVFNRRPKDGPIGPVDPGDRNLAVCAPKEIVEFPFLDLVVETSHNGNRAQNIFHICQSEVKYQYGHDRTFSDIDKLLREFERKFMTSLSELERDEAKQIKGYKEEFKRIVAEYKNANDRLQEYREETRSGNEYSVAHKLEGLKRLSADVSSSAEAVEKYYNRHKAVLG